MKAVSVIHPLKLGAPQGETEQEPSRARTRARDIYERLRLDIVECRLKPGQKLRFDETRTTYQVGLSPLREALMRLASEGLVVLEDQRGFHVAPVSRTDLLDVTRMRQELESMALRMAIESGSDEWEAEVLAAYHRLSKVRKVFVSETEDPHSRIINPQWEEHHRNFHRSLVSACGSPWLMHFRGLLYDQADRYRRLSLQYLRHPRADLDEHRALMEAAITRDAIRAAELIKRHIGDTTEALLAADPSIYGERYSGPKDSKSK
jgi:GntR family carbon starvation induced transcriptional regulator